VTERKSGPALQNTPGSRVVAVMRRDVERAQDYARRHNVARWYGDVESLLADEEVNAIYIATPPGSHAELCLRAAATNRPIYVEKPMARTKAECDAMIAACSNVPLFVAYYRRALPRFVRVKQLLDEGAIGDVRTVEITLRRPLRDDELTGNLPWRVIPEIAGGGHFVDLASHTLDLLDWLLGPVAEARGFALNNAGLYPAEDTVSCALRFQSGAVGSGSFSFCARDRADRVVIAGNRGELSFATFAEEPIVLTTSAGESREMIANPDPIQGPLIGHIVAQLLGRGQSPSTGETAARTSGVIDAILRGR
jgi:predicted dehydrogenase